MSEWPSAALNTGDIGLCIGILSWFYRDNAKGNGHFGASLSHKDAKLRRALGVLALLTPTRYVLDLVSLNPNLYT